LRPVLLPLERAKQRLRLVLEALDQRNNSNNDNGGGGGGQPDENTCVQQQHTAGSARESPAVPSTPPPILPRTEVPLPPSPAVLDALKVCARDYFISCLLLTKKKMTFLCGRERGDWSRRLCVSLFKKKL